MESGTAGDGQPPAKKDRLHAEVRSLVKIMKGVAGGLTATTTTLDATNQNFQDAKQEIEKLCVQTGNDRVLAKYFLTGI